MNQFRDIFRVWLYIRGQTTLCCHLKEKHSRNMHPIDFICGRQGDYMFSAFKSSLGESWAADLMARTSCTIWTEQNRKANWKGLDELMGRNQFRMGYGDMMGYDGIWHTAISQNRVDFHAVHDSPRLEFWELWLCRLCVINVYKCNVACLIKKLADESC